MRVSVRQRHHSISIRIRYMKAPKRAYWTHLLPNYSNMETRSNRDIKLNIWNNWNSIVLVCVYIRVFLVASCVNDPYTNSNTLNVHILEPVFSHRTTLSSNHTQTKNYLHKWKNSNQIGARYQDFKSIIKYHIKSVCMILHFVHLFSCSHNII